MRIAFFGTPEFAVPSLQALLDRGAGVVGVVTQPDRPRGRSRSTLVPPPVKTLALAHGLPVLQPEKPVGDEFLTAFSAWRTDLAVVVAYGHLLRPALLALPVYGMINVHASLLPHLRGAAPINWAILRGETETGVSIMRMEQGLDSGPVLLQARIALTPEETAGTLTARLAELGAATLLEALDGIRHHRLEARAQDQAGATFAPKIDRALTRVDWNDPADAVSRRIRAFDPAPGAWTTLDGQNLKLFGARSGPGSGRAGAVIKTGNALRIATGSGAVEVAEIQPAGRPRMSAVAWMNGRGVTEGQTFE